MQLNIKQASIIVLSAVCSLIPFWATFPTVFSFSSQNNWQALYRESTRAAAEKAEKEKQKDEKYLAESRAQLAQRDAQRKVFETQYNQKFESWKQGILGNTAVTGVAASSKFSILITLTPDKYQSVNGAKNIARQLARSYCLATGVNSAHFYVMLGDRLFADAWND
jgi:hypothetical protein